MEAYPAPNKVVYSALLHEEEDGEKGVFDHLIEILGVVMVLLIILLGAPWLFALFFPPVTTIFMVVDPSIGTAPLWAEWMFSQTVVFTLMACGFSSLMEEDVAHHL